MRSIEWLDEAHFRLGGVDFVCVLKDYAQHHTDESRVVLIKDPSTLLAYVDFFKDRPPKTILEFGVFEGGSAVFFSLLFDVEKYVGIDLRPPVEGLNRYLATHPVGDRVRLHYRTSQDDAAAIRRIVQKEFGDDPIDLIIDDGSHMYDLTRRSFEIAFPLLKPGGTYSIEDWGWAHWPEYQGWEDKPAMSRLILELVLGSATSRQWISEVRTNRELAFVVKAPDAPDATSLSLESLYRVRGKDAALLGADSDPEGERAKLRSGLEAAETRIGTLQRDYARLRAQEERNAQRIDGLLREEEDREATWQARVRALRSTWARERSVVLSRLRARQDAASERADSLERYVREMQQSLVFVLLHRYRVALDRVAPLGSRLRRAYVAMLSLVRRLLGLAEPGSPSPSAGAEEKGLAGRPRAVVPAPRLTQPKAASEAWTEAHREQADGNPWRAAHRASLATALGASSEYVPYAPHSFGTASPPVRLIAFYLPQFHPIPENDRWWGKGFTEWTNVSKAVPQFAGHYQPRLPGELGFYDLRVPDVLRRQVELAKSYGVHGFCFHYYWFNGKRLLERPLETFLDDPELNFPFCLCWANENWTRRWDGLENDILIAQEYSEGNDEAFIEDLERYLRHPNYIRVNGRPVLIVYRANLLPDPRRTAERWKEHCRRVGMPEPFLVAAQTFGFEDPTAIGFDAAVEFPPHNVARRRITDRVTVLGEDYAGRVFSYWGLVAGFGLRPTVATYPRIPAVVPSWDNEARRPGEGHTFVHATPMAYGYWLSLACRRASKDSGDLVFLNAWNEWGESAYLEPDQRFGYAYLDTTARVLSTIAAGAGDLPGEAHPTETARRETAIIVHLGDPELAGEMRSALTQLGADYDLYVSVPEAAGIEDGAIHAWKPDAQIRRCENRGRDIAPFLEVFREIAPLGYRYICKIHSDASPPFVDGSAWRQALLAGMLGSPEEVGRIKEIFDQSPEVGLVVGAGAAMDSAADQSNTGRFVDRLRRMVGLTPSVQAYAFPGGSMFWFRPDALLPLAAVPLKSADFEKEFGQKDGTLAHGVDRFFGLLCESLGFQVIELPEGRGARHRGGPAVQHDRAGSPGVRVPASDPIVVFQMGKVGSRSVVEGLSREYVDRRVEKEIHHVHLLAELDEIEAEIRRERKDPGPTVASIARWRALRDRIAAEADRAWNVISLTREPVGRNVAAFFQAIDETEPEWRTLFSEGRLTLDRLQEMFLDTPTIHRAPEEWFDRQLKAVFGVDVYRRPFPHRAGYGVYRDEPRAPTLVIRVEDLDRCADAAMREFLGLHDFRLVRINVGDDKDYAEIYQAFKRIPLPKDYVERMYATKFARHFYTDDERAALTARWTGRA